jgi:hypothetical protein
MRAVAMDRATRIRGSAHEHGGEWRRGVSDHHAMTFGLILPRMLIEHVLLPSA